MTMSEWCEHIRRTHTPRVITTWLQEFGYRCEGVPGRDVILAVAGERGLTRWARELDAHGKRLADRAQFDSRRMTGRAGVIR